MPVIGSIGRPEVGSSTPLKKKRTVGKKKKGAVGGGLGCQSKRAVLAGEKKCGAGVEKESVRKSGNRGTPWYWQGGRIFSERGQRREKTAPKEKELAICGKNRRGFCGSEEGKSRSRPERGKNGSVGQETRKGACASWGGEKEGLFGHNLVRLRRGSDPLSPSGGLNLGGVTEQGLEHYKGKSTGRLNPRRGMSRERGEKKDPLRRGNAHHGSDWTS